MMLYAGRLDEDRIRLREMQGQSIRFKYGQDANSVTITQMAHSRDTAIAFIDATEQRPCQE